MADETLRTFLDKTMNRHVKSDTESNKSEEERPPIFRTWGRLYFAVIGNLLLLIAIFYLITRMFS